MNDESKKSSSVSQSQRSNTFEEEVSEPTEWVSIESLSKARVKEGLHLHELRFPVTFTQSESARKLAKELENYNVTGPYRNEREKEEIKKRMTKIVNSVSYTTLFRLKKEIEERTKTVSRSSDLNAQSLEIEELPIAFIKPDSLFPDD